MEAQLSRRSVVVAALAVVTVPVSMSIARAQEAKDAPMKGKLTDPSLGTLLKAMGLDAKLSEQRYDFAFKSTIEDAEWELSLSAVLSQDGTSIWIMAWLDELPKSSADVPRTALLRLLSDSDKLGKGKFFAYIAANRRFVLQRVIPNENITALAFRGALDDLGQSVVATHAHWSVANWGSTTTEDPATTNKIGTQVKGSAPQASVTATGATSVNKAPNRPPLSADSESKFKSSAKQ